MSLLDTARQPARPSALAHAAQPDHNSPEEVQRLSLLAELGVLDIDPEPGFDALTHAAAALTRCPIALISLVDGERQWFKARVGLKEWQTPRDGSFCNHAIRTAELMEVCDATADLRFAKNRWCWAGRRSASTLANRWRWTACASVPCV